MFTTSSLADVGRYFVVVERRGPYTRHTAVVTTPPHLVVERARQRRRARRVARDDDERHAELLAVAVEEVGGRPVVRVVVRRRVGHEPSSVIRLRARTAAVRLGAIRSASVRRRLVERGRVRVRAELGRLDAADDRHGLDLRERDAAERERHAAERARHAVQRERERERQRRERRGRVTPSHAHVQFDTARPSRTCDLRETRRRAHTYSLTPPGRCETRRRAHTYSFTPPGCCETRGRAKIGLTPPGRGWHDRVRPRAEQATVLSNESTSPPFTLFHCVPQVQFPDDATDAGKARLLGGVFLLNQLYFETSKNDGSAGAVGGM